MSKFRKIQSRKSLLATVGITTIAFALMALPASAIVPNDDHTSEDVVDTSQDVTGVGMFFRNDGFVCSGTLINPRTVLFAAHCVNDRPASDYGPTIQSAWSFQTNALPGFSDWIANSFGSNPDLFVYNNNQVIYNLDSIARPESSGFLEGDIALSSLDTPASNIPTWALLFSPLDTPSSIDPVTGTGYHVNITGYGRSGSGTTGASLGIDWRRRAAENMLGALTSFDDRNTFLFGDPFGDLPQNLYRLDFDDPNGTNPYDFNLYRDEALANEGTTAGGDSGGPLIIDAANNSGFDEDVVIGVLSGGSRFFGPQVFSSYGTESFYQPLFYYWDWIAANNPYRYVGANAGDGNWEDSSHWATRLDPNYRVIDASGAVVNGTPSNPGAGLAGDEPSFGIVCFDPNPRGEGVGDSCQNLETGDPEPLSVPSVQSGIAQLQQNLDGNGLIAVSIDGSVGAEQQSGIGAADLSSPTLVDLENQPQAGGYLDDPLPSPTIDNGLVGATGFVPGNIDPDIGAGINARYFDVTLSADGTTTLSSVVEIDRLTVAGSGAALDIAASGSLTSLIDVMHVSGTVNVDGSLVTPGDYLNVGGLLSGSGTITTPFLTNVAGAIAPGGLGTEGQLSIDGSLILSSGSILLMDVSATGNDLLNVSGDVSLGGVIELAGAAAYGDQYSVMSYGGTSSGAFSDVTGLGAGVLQALITDAGGVIQLSIDAGSFLDVLPEAPSGVQRYYAQSLDGARGTSYSDLSELYSLVDLLGPTDLAAAFDAIAPNDAITSGQGAIAMGDALGKRLDARLRQVRRGERGFVTQGSAAGVQVASLDAMSSFSLISSQLAAVEASEASGVRPMKDGYGGFASIDFFTGDADSGLAGRKADIEGFAITGGIDKTIGTDAIIGGMISYSSSDNTMDSGMGDAEISGASVGLYGYVPFENRVFVDGHVSYGSYSVDMSRTAQLVGGTLAATGDTNADQLLVGASVGREYEFNNGINVTPSAGLLHASYDIDAYSEKGSVIAMDVASRDLTSTQLSLGAVIDWELGESGSVRPMLGAAVVHDLDAGHDVVLATFVGAPTASAVVFAGPDRSRTWLDLEAGLDVNVSDSMVATIAVKQTVNRDELSQTVIGASATLKF